MLHVAGNSGFSERVSAAAPPSAAAAPGTPVEPFAEAAVFGRNQGSDKVELRGREISILNSSFLIPDCFE